MKFHDALALCGLGLGMISLPAVLPDYFPANAADGSNTSALWLSVMGAVNVLIGGLNLFRLLLWPTLVRVLAWNPVKALQAPAQILRPSFDRYSYRADREKVRQLAA